MTTETPTHGWRPILALLSVILVVGFSAVALAWTHSKRDDHATKAGCPKGVERQQVELAATDAAATPEQLEADAGILRKRIAPYDCGNGPDVAVASDRLRVTASAAAISRLDELIRPGELQFREVLDARPGPCDPPARAAADAEMAACSIDGSESFQLGPAKVVSSALQSATAQRDQQLGQWQVIVHFTDEGQKRWTALTAQLVGKRVAIVVDGVVITAPTIQERIDGDAQITGDFTDASANALVAVLAHGPLPVGLRRI